MIDLTPLDVRNKIGDFRRVMRGYDPAEVDAFVELCAERLEELVKEVVRLRERSELLQAQVTVQEEREGAVKEALVTAQQLREDVKGQAEREAAVIVREAELRARERVGEVERQIEAVRGSLEELKRRRVRFLKSLRASLQRELDVLEVEEARDFFDDVEADPVPRRGNGSPDLAEGAPAPVVSPRVAGEPAGDGDADADGAVQDGEAPASGEAGAQSGEDDGLWLSTILKDENEERGSA